MTQAHKTPGALVELKPLDPGQPWEQELLGPWVGRVLEVLEEYPKGHVVVIDHETREPLFPSAGQGRAAGLHEERLQTISPERRRQLGKTRGPGR